MARMKVLLTEDVPSLGMAGEVHAVAGGFARNYLIPAGRSDSRIGECLEEGRRDSHECRA